MATCNVHKWVTEVAEFDSDAPGLELLLDKNEKSKKKWKEAIHNIQEKFLDDVFDINSKVERTAFITAIIKTESWLFDAKEIRQRVLV